MNVLQTERGQKGNLLCCVIRSLEVKISVLVGIPSAAVHATLDQDTVPIGKSIYSNINLSLMPFVIFRVFVHNNINKPARAIRWVA